MLENTTIRPYDYGDKEAVEELFIEVNRLLAPDSLKEAFENYISRSLEEEISRIPDYYDEKGGSFSVAELDGQIIGMFGLEAREPSSMEIRRMYVSSNYRRKGIAKALMSHAESICRRAGIMQIELSTSEVQGAAVAFYKSLGFQVVKEERAMSVSNKTIGGGILRFYFTKNL
ncbi:MAG: GNAT family N-acetyltransferase [Sneathiella sp.]|nr:GNAT family N-acetyltransferase [Sneathiella sp.]